MESQVIYSDSHSWHAGAGDRVGCPAWEAVIQCAAWWVGSGPRWWAAVGAVEASWCGSLNTRGFAILSAGGGGGASAHPVIVSSH